MKLYTAKATPFGRTVEVVAHELGLHEDMEIIATKVAPVSPNEDYQELNPLRKIPALVLDDGTLLVDSGLIAQYLAARVGDTHMFAEKAPGHWKVMNDYMLAKGMTDCLVAARYESFARPEDLRWQGWIDDQLGKAHATLARFDAEPPQSEGRLNIASIALASVLGYLDFRFADQDWRSRYENLARWVEPIHERPSFTATQPQ